MLNSLFSNHLKLYVSCCKVCEYFVCLWCKARGTVNSLNADLVPELSYIFIKNNGVTEVFLSILSLDSETADGYSDAIKRAIFQPPDWHIY